MSILFVLLTFLLILSIMYFRRPEAPAVSVQPASFQKIPVKKMLRMGDLQVPQEYAFHPITLGFTTKATRMRASELTHSRAICSARSTPSRSWN